jgi:signal transduction histidine kinase
MTDPDRSANVALTSDPQSEWAAKMSEREMRIAELEEELAQTNQGVVALYSELDIKADELRQATELKSRFLSYMSHEFRTPLGAILSLTRLLLDHTDGPLRPEQERQVAFIHSSAEELTDMVNDLLDLAKIEAGRLNVSAAWFEMVDLFAALRGTFKPLLHSSDVVLIFEEPTTSVRMFTDDRKLAQILRNYISNALKFTQHGDVRVTAALDNGYVTFSVADTGIGIAAEHLPALFHDFVQIDAPIQKRLRGSGLGLSLSKRLAELLHGKVWVTSEVGVGSTFYISIPRSTLPAACSKSAATKCCAQ